MRINSLDKERDYTHILKTLKQYEVVNIHSPDFTMTRILCGAINRNFKVFDGSKTLLLKVLSNNDSLPINRRQVFSMQEELAILGLAPMPLFLNQDCTIYCEQWIDIPSDCTPHNRDGMQQSKVDINQRKASVIDTLAEVLCKVHSSFVPAPLLALDKHWQMYWQKIKCPNQQLRETYEQVNQQWLRSLEQGRSDFVICHNDLHLDHISFVNGPVFDWEYAGLGCRYFDIASCCAINKLEHVDILKLCTRYADLANKDAKEVISNVKRKEVMVAFTSQLWTQSMGKMDSLK
jgi:hypothetical protein